MTKQQKEKDLENFESTIGVAFQNKMLLKQALTHRSFVNEHRSARGEHNERLEFLGDAVLELISSNYLYQKYPNVQEGDLTAYRAGLVNTHSLSETAGRLGMNEFLLLSKGEAKDMGRARHSILADSFEAVLGAMYLDQGYDIAESFLKRVLFPKTEEIVKKRLWQDAKSLFQEKAQDIHGITPSYDVLTEGGPDHQKTFTAGAFIADELVAKAEGPSKQEAEQSAAEEALKSKGWR